MIRRTSRRAATLLCAALFASACAAAPSSLSESRLEHVYHGSINSNQLGVIREAIERETPAIAARLGLDSPQSIKVEYWQDEEAYQQAMEQILGSRAPGSRGYVTGPGNVRVLVTGMLQAPKESVHEVAHALTLQLNPTFGNDPRWLWEATAQYYADEQRDPSMLRDGLLEGCPSMEVLNAPFDAGGSVYRFGFTLSAEVVRQGGEQALVDLIKANGDTQAILGMSLEEFHQAWCDHLQQQLRE